MRRGLAGLILGLSLVVASVSWAGFVMSRTVLDPNRSERLADQLLDNEALRTAMVGRLSDAMGAALPADVPVPRQQLEVAADAALEDPRVEGLIRDGIVRVHQNALEGNSEPVVVDATALGSASRDSLVSVRPELDLLLPEAPALEIELPTTGLSWLGSLRRAVVRFTTVLALAAAAGALTSLLVTSNRPAVLRRVSFWAFGAATFWLVVGYGIPFLAQTLAPSSSAIVAAIIDVFFGAMIGPALAMAVVGAALLGLSMVWASMSDRQGAARLQPRRADAGPPVVTTTGSGSSTGRPIGAPTGVREPTARGGQRSNVRPTSPRSAAPADTSGQPPVRSAPVTATTPTVPGDSAPAQDPTTILWQDPTPAPPAPGPRWVEGVGYVDDTAQGEGRDPNR